MKKLLLTASSILTVIVSLASGPAQAFYNSTDTTEAYGILPNHTAFWVPGMGDTKNTQAQLESEEFFRQNKVPGKFFIIPHSKLSGSTYLGWDKYVPTGRLIIVDRAPFFHEWTKRGRGTSSNSDQSFPCHSRDNIEVTAEISLAASVVEENAAKFLYYFGVNQPAGDPASPEVIFTSIYHSRNLEQIMNTWGRGEIQSRVCREISNHDVETLGNSANAILDSIQAAAKEFFLKHGITVEYVGWAGGFSYPAEVSSAINTRFAAEHIAGSLDVLERKARIDAIAGWDRKLPTTIMMGGNGDTNMMDMMFGAKALGQQTPTTVEMIKPRSTPTEVAPVVPAAPTH